MIIISDAQLLDSLRRLRSGGTDPEYDRALVDTYMSVVGRPEHLRAHAAHDVLDVQPDPEENA